MKIELIVIVGIFAFFAMLEMVQGGFFKKRGQTRADAIVEIIGSIVLLTVTQPLVLLCAYGLMHLIVPHQQGALHGLPIIAQLALFLIFDDLTQYLWHRTSHNVPFLYSLHRAHHNADYMSVRIVYRNNIFYYAMMPGIWLSGALIYLGMGWVYAFYAVVKLTVIMAAHSDVRWDAPLYRVKWLSPVMWVVERTISTPSTHSAHHGKFSADPNTYYKGNYGNLLFFWDVLFGTARITRGYPADIGVENLPPVDAKTQLLWPLFKAT